MSLISDITDKYARSLYNNESQLVFDPLASIQRYQGDEKQLWITLLKNF
jgi:hypothetical protein